MDQVDRSPVVAGVDDLHRSIQAHTKPVRDLEAREEALGLFAPGQVEQDFDDADAVVDEILLTR